MPPPAPEPRPASWWAIDLPADLLLPAVCPGCLAPGSRAESVPVVDLARTPAPPSPGARPVQQPGRPPVAAESLGLTAHYCDLCADARAAEVTRLLGLEIAASLLSIALATTISLILGSLHLGLQVAAVLLCSGLFGIGLWLLDRPLPPLYIELTPEGTTLLARQRGYLQLLGVPTPRHIGRPGHSPLKFRPFFAATAALVWLGGLHAFGGAKIVVVLGGLEPAVVTVDHRLRAVAAGTPEERPGPGTVVATLGGRRHIALIAESGDVLVDEVLTLWPGRTYVISKPPQSLCFYVETQEYGESGRRHYFQPLRPATPVWELPVVVDRWFAAPEERPALPTTGGVRRALRLLPCMTMPLAGRAP